MKRTRVKSKTHKTFITLFTSSHAADVLQTVNLLLLSDQKMAEHFSKLDIFAACIASAAHDVDHPVSILQEEKEMGVDCFSFRKYSTPKQNKKNYQGLNNNFLVQSGHKLAIMYNDLSVLEFHHASKAFQIASRSECNIFSGMASDQIRDVRKLVIGMVVATGVYWIRCVAVETY